jgi:integrase
MAHITPVERKAGTAYEVHWRQASTKRMRTFSAHRDWSGRGKDPALTKAEAFARKVEDELAAGNSTTPLVRHAKTFRQVAEDSLAASKGRLKPRTYDGYVQVYSRHVFPTLGGYRIGAITGQHIEQWIADLAETLTTRTGEPLHPSTIKHAFIAANKVFRYAIKHRLISHNPATGTSLPRIQHAQRFEPTFLAPDEIERLAAALDAHAPDGLFVRVAAYTGLRAGELLALQVRDMNLLRRKIEVRRTLVRTSDGWKEDSPKSEKSIRSVPLRRALADNLADYLAEHPNKHLPTAPLWPGRNYGGYGAFRGGLDWSKRIDYESFYRRRFRAAAETIGHPQLRFHDLRHSAASLFAASGMPLAKVSRILGHADTTTTYKVYLHFFPDDWDADMDRLDALLAPRDAGPVVRRLRRTAEGDANPE